MNGRVVLWSTLLAGVALAGCTPAYVVRPVSEAHYEPSTAVQIIEPPERPALPFVTIAQFQGSERHRCPEQQRYCSLMDEARKAGADAIWIQHSDESTYPGEWKMIKGKLTHIYGFTNTTIDGVFIRYAAH